MNLSNCCQSTLFNKLIWTLLIYIPSSGRPSKHPIGGQFGLSFPTGGFVGAVGIGGPAVGNWGGVGGLISSFGGWEGLVGAVGIGGPAVGSWGGVGGGSIVVGLCVVGLCVVGLWVVGLWVVGIWVVGLWVETVIQPHGGQPGVIDGVDHVTVGNSEGVVEGPVT